MIIIIYTITLFIITIDEAWNINHPRPNPRKKYYAMQWEKDDFYTKKINDEWVLRKYRKTDSETKRVVREEYWEKRLKIEK